MKTIKASVAIKSADIILEQNGDCFSPISIDCNECPLYGIDCSPHDKDCRPHRVKLLNELRGK